jgi:hypothetical protein
MTQADARFHVHAPFIGATVVLRLVHPGKHGAINVTSATSIKYSGNAAHKSVFVPFLKSRVGLRMDQCITTRHSAPGLEQSIVEILVTLSHGFKAEATLDDRPPGRSRYPRPSGIDRVGCDLLSHRIYIGRLNQLAGPTRFNQFTIAADVVAITGKALAIASRMVFDTPSASEGSTKQSSPRRISGTSSRSPGSHANSATPACSSSACACARSGPSPIITSRRRLPNWGNVFSTRMKASASARLILDHLHAPDGTDQATHRIGKWAAGNRLTGLGRMKT